MKPEEDKPNTEHPNAPQKSTAPREMPGWTPREAARYGIWSDVPRGIRYRPPYSKT
jgi:hypothetical protein